MNILRKKISSTFIRCPHHAAGFTLIEFIVIISIFTIIAGISLFNFTGFRSAVGLDNLAHDIALSIHKVQVESGSNLSASIISSGSDTVPAIGRGIVFTYNTGLAKYDPSFTIFDDTDGDHEYRAGSDVLIDQIAIQTQEYIEGVYTSPDGITFSAAPTSDITILFERPWPNAIMPALSSGDMYLKIVVTTVDGSLKRSIIISRAGQISVE